MTRLPDVDTSRTSAQVRDLLAALPDLGAFRIVAHAQTVLLPWVNLGSALLNSLALDPVLRELVILQAVTSAGAEYERVQHEAIAARVGVPPDMIAAVTGSRLGDPNLTGVAPVLRVVDELVRTHTTGQAGLDALRSRLGDRQTVEVILVVGFYLSAAMLMAAVDLDIDPPQDAAVIEAAAAFCEDEEAPAAAGASMQRHSA
jgi:alkylhydroperoxidase family enzyme